MIDLSNVIDISKKLTNDKPSLKLSDELIIDIDNGKNAVLKMNQMLATTDTSNPEELDKILEVLVGESGVKAINDLKPTMTDFTTIFIGVMAGALGEDFDTVEARFRTAAEEA